MIKSTSFLGLRKILTRSFEERFSKQHEHSNNSFNMLALFCLIDSANCRSSADVGLKLCSIRCNSGSLKSIVIPVR